MAQISRECAYIQKDAKNTHFKYKYASAEAVLQKVNEAMTSRNVAKATQVEYEVLTPGHVIAKLRIILVNGDDPKENSLIFEGIGEGKDTGDKASMKALTAAHKYAYATGLGISWGDDPEADSSTDKAASNDKTTKNGPSNGLKDLL